MALLIGFGVDFFVFIILGAIMSELIVINPWYGLPILALMVILTAFSGYITAHKSKNRKIRNTLIVSISFYLIVNSSYHSGLVPSYLDNLYAVQIIPLSLFGSFISNIIHKKQTFQKTTPYSPNDK